MRSIAATNSAAADHSDQRSTDTAPSTPGIGPDKAGAGDAAGDNGDLMRAHDELHFLAAEDNDLNQFVLKFMLEDHGHCLTFVKNGEAAVQAWAAGSFDLILMDIHMPVVDGTMAIREIRRREASTGAAGIPIIALTANALSDQIATYFAAGADGYVAKPIDEGELLRAIAAAMDGWATVLDTARAPQR